MSTYALSSDLFAMEAENDRRFKRLLSAFGIPALIFGIIIPFLQVAEIIDVTEPVKRIAKLLPKPPEPEPPKPEPKKEEPVKPKPKPKALTEEQKIAKAKAKVDRMRETFDALADLRDKSLDTPAQLNTQVITSNTASRRSVDATRTSGGIGDTTVVDRNASTSIGSRKTTAVESGIKTGTGTSGGDGGRSIGRTPEEIQVVFDRTKGAFYAIYKREQRKRPDMVGKLVVTLTILPSGKVKSAKVVSSELNNKEFERKIIARILLMDFGAKDVGIHVVEKYPLVFFPS